MSELPSYASISPILEQLAQSVTLRDTVVVSKLPFPSLTFGFASQEHGPQEG